MDKIDVTIVEKALQLLDKYHFISANKIMNETGLSVQTICNYRNRDTVPQESKAKILVDFFEKLEGKTPEEQAKEYENDNLQKRVFELEGKLNTLMNNIQKKDDEILKLKTLLKTINTLTNVSNL